jgi:UDP-N-acetyl-2-amino-2-deoxyglucuronate dehydrogenase
VERLNVAIVGAGAIAQRNAREAKASGVAEISGVFDVNSQVARDLADALGSRPVERFEDILEDDKTDAILLSVPHHLHRPMAVAAAEHGKHVLVEKPLANTLAEAEDILRACRENDVMLTVNYSFRFLPKYQMARQLVEEGALGEIAGAQLLVHQFKDKGYWTGARSNSPDDWRASKEKCGGGYLIMNVCHVLDYMYYIMNMRAERVYAEYATRSSPAEVEDIVTATFTMENGAVGSISASSIMRGMEQAEQRVWGTNGSLLLTDSTLEFYSTRPILGKRPGRLHKVKKFPNVSWTAEWVKDFVAAVGHGTPPTVGLVEGWDNLAFIEAAYHSMETGSPISVRRFPGQN